MPIGNERAAQQQTCIYHQNQPITNFCRDAQCLMPLCPYCIEQHLEIHRQNNQFAKIDNIDKVCTECKDIVQLLTDNYESSLRQVLEFKQSCDVNKSSYKEKLYQSKLKLMKIIDHYYEQLEEDLLATQVQQNLQYENDIYQSQKFLETKINDARLMKNKLFGPKYVKYIVRLLSSDYITENKHYQQQCQMFLEQLGKQQIDVAVDETKLYTFNMELAKYVTLKNNALYKQAPGAQLQNINLPL